MRMGGLAERVCGACNWNNIFIISYDSKTHDSHGEVRGAWELES